MTITHPTFHIGDVTRLADGTALFSVYANGKAPLNGGGANGVPLGRLIGRTWKTDSYGWVAAPLPIGAGQDSWHAEVARSLRYFRTRRDACLILYGYAMGAGAARAGAARAAVAPAAPSAAAAPR